MTLPVQADLFLENFSDAKQAWAQCLLIIKEKVSSLSFKTWFQPIVPIRLNNKELIIQVPSQFFYDWIEEHYDSLLQEAVLVVLGESSNISYSISIEEHDAISLLKPDIDKEPFTNDLNRLQPFSPHVSLRSENLQSIRNNLNPRYLFENFIKGDCNQLARAAALAVANNPGGTSFNPLVLYGGTGLGKTHLVHALGNHASSNGKSRRIAYISSEKFTVDFIEAVQGDKVGEFSSFYRSMDLLIVDDIQFFAGKEKTQDNFFHTFNTLYQLGKQIVLTSDVPPKELRGLDERLISRFQCGLTADIQPPDLETRIAILQKKSQENSLELPSEVIDFVAASVTKNIRELEGCLISLFARASLENREVDVELAKDVLRVIVNDVRVPISIDKIQKVVCEFFDIPIDLLRAKTRRQEVVIARQTAMFLAKDLTNSSLKTIGLHFGGRDHSTVIHACQAVEEFLKTDVNFKTHFDQIRKKIEFNR